MIPEIKKDPVSMIIARDASWLCGMFQECSLKAKEKQEVLVRLIKHLKNDKP